MSYVNSNPLTECKIADEVSDCWTAIKKRLDTAITYFIPIEIGKQLSAMVTCCQLAKNELYWKIFIILVLIIEFYSAFKVVNKVFDSRLVINRKWWMRSCVSFSASSNFCVYFEALVKLKSWEDMIKSKKKFSWRAFTFKTTVFKRYLFLWLKN